MSKHDDLIDKLAELVGIAARYTDVYGKSIASPREARQAILSDFGLKTSTAGDTQESISRVEQLRRGLVPPLIPVESGRSVRIPIQQANGVTTATWRVRDERGAIREGRTSLDQESAVALPLLELGYHDLTVEAGGRSTHATVIAAPARCWQPSELSAGARSWGLAAQLYGLRSKRNIGVGTYSDAGDGAEGAGKLGAAFLGLSPVHALFSSDRTKISPYSPSSRLFLEPLHIDATTIPGFSGSRAESLLGGAKERIEALRETALVDHAGVWAVLRPVLDALWEDVGSRGTADFDAFRRALGAPLEAHATFEALSEHFQARGANWMGDWPEAFRTFDSNEVRRFREQNESLVRFHAWLQWLADRQLGEASERARAAGMSLGLYRDLAVGADRGGSEVWSVPERFGPTLSIGAPPDLLAPRGQNWGLPPLDPLALERDGLAAFRALVTANMRHAGAIRIDHAFQLRRLFLIPQGASATHGAYVDYPFEALLAVLRLESHRARCLVIAEDLGTSPEGFSDAIMNSGVLSYRVLAFERKPDGGFSAPSTYPQNALAVITTHDLPTFVGWWRGFDTDLRQTLGIYDQDVAERERTGRVTERQQLSEALFREGLLPSPQPPEAPPFEPVVRYLARTSSVLIGMQYEDVLGELGQPNMPGINEGHPSWRRKLSFDLDAIEAPGGPLAKMAAALSGEGRGRPKVGSALAAPPPRATYRLQFHKGFTFDQALVIVPYLARLGISHIYASPIHKARPGSSHGYDIVDHTAINPELGGEEGFYRLSDALRERGLGLVLDIVPNHMGIGGADNPWWLSVLEWGEFSPAAPAFDVDWERLGANRKLVVPFLGDRYGEALERGDLTLVFDVAQGSFSVWHYEHRFPVCPLAYPVILDRALVAIGEIGTEAAAIALAASERLRTMSEETARERRASFAEESEALKTRIAQAVEDSPGLRVAIERAVTLINGKAGLPESFGTLHRILETQSYRLAHWRVAASDINYRRFFDINGLAGLRIEEPEIFERTHETVFRLVREGRIDGLRIDHIDGLADPAAYIRALQSAIGPGFYIVVEKILEPREPLRPWPVAGTSGYDALNLIDGVFVEDSAEAEFEALYRRATELEGGYGTLLRAAKAEVLESSFASELEVLVSDLKRIADADRKTRDFTVNALRRAVVEIVARFPVYRTYIDASGVDAGDRQLIEESVEKAKRWSTLPDRTTHDFIAGALLCSADGETSGVADRELLRRFGRRFQQLTGPVMAKSLEDTLFYRFVRLLALNEVGGDPERFGLAPDHFHRTFAERAHDWPNAMIATATHDTKRGEDARGRLLALSEMPNDWADAVRRFQAIVAPYLVAQDEGRAPDANDQYMLLQTLLGAWPQELMLEVSEEAIEPFRRRIEEYVTKALREAKRHTSWVNPNQVYEDATLNLVRGLLTRQSDFLPTFRPLARRLAHLGMLTGLARTTLKCTLPGVPDIYQGTEFWDLSLVDPDNRRPVDYDARAAALAEESDVPALLQTWEDGRLKQQLLARLLADRAEAPEFYAKADYQPIAAKGSRARHLLAFHRTHGGEQLTIVVPRLLGGLLDRDVLPPASSLWQDTQVPLPARRWRDIITGTEIASTEKGLGAAELFLTLPIAVLRAIQ